MDSYTEDLEHRNELLIEDLARAEIERDAAIRDLKSHEEIHYSYGLDLRFEDSPSTRYYQCPFRDIRVALNIIKRETEATSLSRTGSPGYCTIHLNKLYMESTSIFFLLEMNFNKLQEVSRLLIRPLAFSYDDFKLDEELNFIETNFKFSNDCVYGDRFNTFDTLENLKNKVISK